MKELCFSPNSAVFDASCQLDGSKLSQRPEHQRHFLQQLRNHLERLFGEHEVELLYKIVDGRVTFSDIARKRACHRAQPSRDFDRLVTYARERHICSLAQKMIELTQDHGGCTLNPWTIEPVVSGYSVGIDGLETRFTGKPRIAIASKDVHSKFTSISESNSPLFFRAWRNDCEYVFGIVRVFDAPDEAAQFCVAQSRRSVFNIQNTSRGLVVDVEDHVIRAA